MPRCASTKKASGVAAKAKPDVSTPKKTSASQNGRPVVVFDPSDPDTIKRIREAGTSFDKRLSDPAAADRVRTREGIYTKRGKLTKAFSA
jgi:hypothetical protein